jgi:hypothetical protein
MAKIWEDTLTVQYRDMRHENVSRLGGSCKNERWPCLGLRQDNDSHCSLRTIKLCTAQEDH